MHNPPFRGSRKICVNGRNRHLFLMEDFYADYTGNFRSNIERLRKARRFIKRKRFIAAIDKALVERALNGELTHNLDYEKHDPAGNNSGNSRNSTSPKILEGKRGRKRKAIVKIITAKRIQIWKLIKTLNYSS